MPLWLIYHPTGTFEDDATKQALSRDITAMYTDRGLPEFYVVVNFIKLAGNDVYVGGRPNTETPFIRSLSTTSPSRNPIPTKLTIESRPESVKS